MVTQDANEERMLQELNSHDRKVERVITNADPFLKDTLSAVRAILKLAAQNGWSEGVSLERACLIAEEKYDELLRLVTGEGLRRHLDYKELKEE